MTGDTSLFDLSGCVAVALVIAELQGIGRAGPAS
ncbi:MAG: hypothetical protein JWN43_1303 [Gammaproteobacteria bacterium]|nr:hypothetical protein [Gammaproteobacteria bacterium]